MVKTKCIDMLKHMEHVMRVWSNPALITIFTVHGVFAVSQALWSVKERRSQNRTYNRQAASGANVQTGTEQHVGREAEERTPGSRGKNTRKQRRRSGWHHPESHLFPRLASLFMSVQVCCCLHSKESILTDKSLHMHCHIYIFNHWSKKLWLGSHFGYVNGLRITYLVCQNFKIPAFKIYIPRAGWFIFFLRIK